MKEKIYILDTTVFAEKQASKFVGNHGTDVPSFAAAKACVTVYDVAEELKSLDSKIEFERLRNNLHLVEPEKKFVDEVETAVKKTNDKLTNTDKKILALALHFKAKNKHVILVSDDYGVQNTAKALKIEFLPLVQKGIKQQFEWKKRCKACGTEILGKDAECPICGSEGKFVPKRK